VGAGCLKGIRVESDPGTGSVFLCRFRFYVETDEKSGSGSGRFDPVNFCLLFHCLFLCCRVKPPPPPPLLLFLGL